MLSRKMNGAVAYSDFNSIGESLREISEIIDSYDLAGQLSNEEGKYKKVQQEFITMTVQGEKVESILGRNYRVNLFKDGSIEFNFSKIVNGYQLSVETEAKIKEFPYESKTYVNTKGYGEFEVKANLKLGTVIDLEKLMELIFSLEVK